MFGQETMLENLANGPPLAHSDLVLVVWLMGAHVRSELVGNSRAALLPDDGRKCAAKVAVHRMRKRFAELLREEVANPVESEDAVGDEIRYLIDALAS